MSVTAFLFIGAHGDSAMESWELGGRQVTANTVAPGYIVTDMTAGLSDQIKSDMLRSIPLKRFGAVDITDSQHV